MAYIEVEVDIDDYLGEATTSYLIEEIEYRNLKVIPATTGIIKDQKLKEKLCDIFGISYHTPNDELLVKVSEIL